MKVKKVPAIMATRNSANLSRSADVNLIKSNIAKANLYLSLLDKNFFGINEFSVEQTNVVKTIEEEIYSFIISRVKLLFGNTEVVAGITTEFNELQVQVLKQLANKALGKFSVPEKEEIVPEVETEEDDETAVNQEMINNLDKLAVFSEDDEDNYYDIETTERVLSTPPGRSAAVKKPAPAKVKKNNKKIANDLTLTRKVTIVDEKGNTKEVESKTEKTVMPPPGMNRMPPATYEQQMAIASATARAQQQKFSKMNE